MSQDTVKNNWRKPWLCVGWKRTFLYRSLIVKSQQKTCKKLTGFILTCFMVLCPADETNNVLAEVTPCESCCQLLNSPFGAIPVNSLVAGCPSLTREISITPWLIRISFCSELTPASQWFIASNPFLSFRIISHFLILPRHCSEGFMTFLLGVKTPLLPGVISVISIIHCCKLDLLKVSKTNQAKMVTMWAYLCISGKRMARSFLQHTLCIFPWLTIWEMFSPRQSRGTVPISCLLEGGASCLKAQSWGFLSSVVNSGFWVMYKTVSWSHPSHLYLSLPKGMWKMKKILGLFLTCQQFLVSVVRFVNPLNAGGWFRWWSRACSKNTFP